MSFFIWHDKFSLGIEAIDRDHKVLVDLIDQLHTGFVNGNVDAAIGPVLAALVDYTHFHFRREEELMAQAGYPGLTAHRRAHAELAREVEEVQARFQSGAPNGKMGTELLAFLHDWLYFHILDEDRAYAPYLVKDYGCADQ